MNRVWRICKKNNNAKWFGVVGDNVVCKLWVVGITKPKNKPSNKQINHERGSDWMFTSIYDANLIGFKNYEQLAMPNYNCHPSTKKEEKRKKKRKEKERKKDCRCLNPSCVPERKRKKKKREKYMRKKKKQKRSPRDHEECISVVCVCVCVGVCVCLCVCNVP